MKAVILAGGMGTRLRPVTYETPKPLVTVKKKPIVNYLIDLFRRHGVSEVALAIHRDHESDFSWWRKRYADEWPGLGIATVVERKQAGTFGALRFAKEWSDGKPFFVSNGDEIKEFDLGALAAFHDTHQPVASVALVEVKEPQRYGVALMNDHLITEFLEKPENPPSPFVNSGLYLLDPAVFSYDNPAEEFLMIEKDVFPRLAKEGKLAGHKVEKGARWFDCGTLERWEEAIKHFSAEESA